MGFANFVKGVQAQLNPFDKGKTFSSFNPKKKKQDEERNIQKPAANPLSVRQPQNQFNQTNTNKPTISTPTNNVSVPKIKFYGPQTADGHDEDLINKIDKPTMEGSYNTTPAQPKADPNAAPVNKGAFWQRNLAANNVKKFIQRNSSPTGNINFVKDVLQGTARGGAQAYLTGNNLNERYGIRAQVNKLMGKDNYVSNPEIKPEGTIQKALFGDQPIKTANTEVREVNKAFGNKLPDWLVGPAAAGLVAINTLQGGKGSVASQLVKKQTEKEVLDLATKNGIKLSAEDAIRIAESKSKKDIAGILEAAKNPVPVNIPVRQVNDIPVRQVNDIPVTATEGLPQNINVRNVTPQGPIIQEVGGDATRVTPPKTQADVYAEKVAERFNLQPNPRPDTRIQGVTPVRTEPYKLVEADVKKSQDSIIDEYASFLKDRGEGNGVDILPNGTRSTNNYRSPSLKGKRMTKQDWRDEAERQLNNGQAPEELSQAYKDAGDPEIQSLLNKGEQPAAPTGTPITVRQVDSIPVVDQTNMPTNLPETPGSVRVTTKTDPTAMKTQASAEQALPKIPKAGTILADGTKVTKRMVESARNQRKLSNKLIKAQQQTSDNMALINANPNTALDGRQPGLILSDQIKKGKKGPYQVARQVDQVSEIDQKSISQIIGEADNSVASNGSLTDRDIANVKDALDSGKVRPGTPEYKKLSDLYWKDGGTHDAQRLALRNQSMHRTGTSTEISNRATSKIFALADDPTKITDKHIADIQKTADDYVNLRDSLAKASDDFNANPTKENYKRFMELDKGIAKAEKNMAMAQYNAAKQALKGNTNIKLRRLIEDEADKADLYTMDFVDSALLSSTGTFVRNFTNATLGSLEEGVFGGIGARAGSLIKGTPIGGGIGRGSFSGFGRGAGNIVNASKSRAKNAGWNPIEHIKNWSTTGNQLGDSMIEGSVGRSVRRQYEQELRKQGYRGNELRMRTDVMARQDPKNLARDLYAPQARKDAGLGSGISKRSTFEKDAQRMIADGFAKTMGKEYSQGGENIAKAVTRLVLGFPSAIGRSLIAGSQRIVPFANVDTVKAFTAPDKTLRAAAIKESIKKSGTAATAATIFGIMGANDMISGSYPKDKEERARWEREGIKENSIRIGDAWYDAPSYLGSFGLPVLIWSSIGRNGGINEESLKDIRSIIGSMSPTEGIDKINEMLDGRADFGKYTQNLAASTGRMATPAGSLLNQISKIFDPTQNDTEGNNWAEGLFNKLVDGIPFLDTTGPLALPDKTDAEGNTLYNPSVAETTLGAAGAVQKGGEQRSQQINNTINSKLSSIDKHGALNDSNLQSVLEGSALDAYNKTKKGKQLDESEIKALQEGLVKGVSSEGTDTSYLEKEQYDTNLTALKLKRDLMNADPTTKPSSLKDIDTAIKRGEVYKKNKVPYQDISDYKDIGVEEWRKMGDESWREDGDPQPDEYNPDMYQKLFEIDKMMSDEGVSYKKGDTSKPKYFLKEKKSSTGRGSSKDRVGTDFGTLKTSPSGPRIQEYETIGQKTGSVPRISVKRPNIVHKITTSR